MQKNFQIQNDTTTKLMAAKNNQTAVEWLFEQVTNLDWKNLIGEKKIEIFEQAKDLEKEQTREAAHEFHFNRNFTDDAFNEWYFRTYEAPEGMITTVKIK